MISVVQDLGVLSQGDVSRVTRLDGTAIESAYRHTADASTVWTPIFCCFGTNFACSSAPPEYIQACRHFRCDVCEDNKPNYQSTKVALPKDNVFGQNLGINVLEIKDVADEPYLCLNILDLGTTFQQVVLLRQRHGSPSSRECLDSFVSLWVGWAGWPQTLSCDRGVHNRGVFARTLAQHGVLIRQAGVESRVSNKLEELSDTEDCSR